METAEFRIDGGNCKATSAHIHNPISLPATHNQKEKLAAPLESRAGTRTNAWKQRQKRPKTHAQNAAKEGRKPSVDRRPAKGSKPKAHRPNESPPEGDLRFARLAGADLAHLPASERTSTTTSAVSGESRRQARATQRQPREMKQKQRQSDSHAQVTAPTERRSSNNEQPHGDQ